VGKVAPGLAHTLDATLKTGVPRAMSNVTKVLLAGLLWVGLGSCAGNPDLVLDPQEWNFGSIPSNQIAHTKISIRNQGPRQARLRFVSTCDCLQIEAAPAALESGQGAVLELSYDPAGQFGFVEVGLIIVIKQRRGEFRRAVRVYGKVLPYGADPAQ
jgi:hypothetical protein